MTNKINTRVVAEVRIDEKEPIVEKPKSVQYAEFKAIIENYKKQNPVKYEAKKDALNEKLNSLK